MSIQKVIQESINGNPLEMKEALAEELRVRVAEALAAKMDEVELDEAFKAGDKVHWEDPDSGKRLTGTVHMAKGSRKGVARVKADGTHGSVWDVHHSHLNKMDEEVDLDEAMEKTHHAARVGTTTWGVGKTPEEAVKDAHKAIHSYYASSAPTRNDKNIDAHMARADKTKKALKVHPIHKSVYDKYATESFDLSDLTLEELEDFMMSKDFEQLDEISKSLATRYMDKAISQRGPEYNRKREKSIALAYRKSTPGVRAGTKYDPEPKVYATDEDFMMSKDFEQLDEISKNTLRSYARKASQQTSDLRDRNDTLATRNLYKGQNKYSTLAHDKKEFDKNAKKINKRSAGISKAVDRLAKEDFDQLDEISKKTLASYVKKAADDKADLTAWRSTNKLHNTDQNTLKKASRYLKNRNAGISKAVDRLAKESFDLSDLTLEELEDFMMSEDFEQLDEISKDLARRYQKAAYADMSKKKDFSNKKRVSGIEMSGRKIQAGGTPYQKALSKIAGTKVPATGK